MAMDPKTIPPAVFQKRAGGKNRTLIWFFVKKVHKNEVINFVWPYSDIDDGETHYHNPHHYFFLSYFIFNLA